MRTISLGIPDLLLEEIDKLIEEKKAFANRSEVIRQAIEELLLKELKYYKSKMEISTQHLRKNDEISEKAFASAVELNEQ